MQFCRAADEFRASWLEATSLGNSPVQKSLCPTGAEKAPIRFTTELFAAPQEGDWPILLPLKKKVPLGT